MSFRAGRTRSTMGSWRVIERVKIRLSAFKGTTSGPTPAHLSATRQTPSLVTRLFRKGVRSTSGPQVEDRFVNGGHHALSLQIDTGQALYTQLSRFRQTGSFEATAALRVADELMRETSIDETLPFHMLDDAGRLSDRWTRSAFLSAGVDSEPAKVDFVSAHLGGESQIVRPKVIAVFENDPEFVRERIVRRPMLERYWHLSDRSPAADIYRRAEEVRTSGGTPIIISDIDGTVYDARKKTERIATDWWYSDSGLPDQHAMDDVGPNGPAPFHSRRPPWRGKRFWETVDALRRHYYPSHLEAGQIASASRHFGDHFFTPGNWRLSEAIDPSVAIIQGAHARDIPILYATLRGRLEDLRADGTSMTEEMLRGIGALERGDEIVFKPGESERLSRADMERARFAEATKAGLAVSHLAERTSIKNPVVIAVLDNDTHQLNLYRDRFGEGPIYVLVEGDTPPKSPPLRIPDAMKFDPYKVRRANSLAEILKRIFRRQQ